MVGRASSPRFVGREAALEALRQAVDPRAGETRTVIFVEGEAGIGKSRLLAEFAREFEDDRGSATRTAIVFGHCVQLTEGSLPYAPIVEVLDELARREGAQSAERATWLRDVLSGSIEGAESSAGSRGRLFLELRDTLVTIADGSPLIVVIDDVHWADQSTLDLIAYLSSRLASTPVILVLAYRSDELDRRHPLKPLLGELQRGRLLDRITLGPLEPEATADQIRAITGNLDEPFMRRVVELADGNPFHVEELVALGGSWSSLPASLRDVLLARIEQLDLAVLSVVRDAAVIGREVQGAVLATVNGRPELEVRDAIRQAVDQFILSPTGDGQGYRFRHALLREAVYEDLLPADRIASHRRVAETLTAEPGLASASPAVAAAEVARHRDAGQQLYLAREAYVLAGELALRARAWSEAAAAFERVLGIDAGHDRPLEETDLPRIRRTAQALWYAGRPHQAAELLRSTLERAGPDWDPLEVAESWQQLSVLLNDVGDGIASFEAGQRTRAIAPRRPPNRVRVRAMDDLASQWMIDGRYRRAIRLASCVIAMADEMGAQDVMVEARAQRGPALLAIGRIDEARRDLDRARDIVTASGDELALGILLYNGGAAFASVGAFEEGLARILEASSIARDLGLERSWDPWLMAAASVDTFWLGRWDETDRQLAVARSLEINGPPLVMAATIQASLAAHRGDGAAAARFLAEAANAYGPGEQAGFRHAAQARASLIAGDAPAAIATVDEGMDVMSAGDDVATRSLLASLGAEAAADLAERLRARRATADAAAWADRASAFARLATDFATGRVVRGSVGAPLTRAHAAIGEAHARRAAGEPDQRAWNAAIVAYEQVGARPTVAWATFRLGEACLVAGDRLASRDSLRQARATALAVGDTALVAAVEGLARRARLDIDTPEATRQEGASLAATPAPNPWNLSDRESEVLALVAEGLTNRLIGDRLFISEKTASSHVTHILDKLGVSSRTEAALAAARAGVLADASSEMPVAAPSDGVGIDRSTG